MNIGGLTNLTYDECSYEQDKKQRSAPLAYQLYIGKFKHCKKCRADKLYDPFDLVELQEER